MRLYLWYLFFWLQGVPEKVLESLALAGSPPLLVPVQCLSVQCLGFMVTQEIVTNTQILTSQRLCPLVCWPPSQLLRNENDM